MSPARSATFAWALAASLVIGAGKCGGSGAGPPADGGPRSDGANGGGSGGNGGSGGGGGSGGAGGAADGPFADVPLASDGPTADSALPPAACADAGSGGGANATVPGALTVPDPTLRFLSIEWAVAGDANLNGTVTVRFRRMGDGTWRPGLPLRRTPAGSLVAFSWANRHAGSLFDLEPATTYEIELSLFDPDGGCEVRTVTATTRAVPAPMPGAPVKPVTPSTFGSASAAAMPGDILELGPGSYAGFTFARSGSPGKPVVIRGTSGATIDGDIYVTGQKHVHLVGLVVNGRVKLNDSEDLAVTRCQVTTTENGIFTYTRARNYYIADNVVTGPSAWNEAALGASGANLGEGILVTGPGHVIEHNRVSGFRDCISFLEDGEAVDQWSLDVVENDLLQCADDGVEADFCFGNCRIVRNRITNTFIALSSQPGLGGPTYFVRNAVYNTILSAFKLQRGSIGDVALHNTVVKNGDAFGIYTTDVFARQYFRNNLLLGGPGGNFNGYSSGTGRVIEIRSADPSGDYDWDGYGSTTGMFTGHVGAVAFASLAELRSKTTEAHAVMVDLGVFAATVPYPAMPFSAVTPPDLRPKAGGAAVDVGLPLANIGDGFAGTAPDLGAHESGAPLPVYGPRP